VGGSGDEHGEFFFGVNLFYCFFLMKWCRLIDMISRSSNREMY